MGTKERRTFTEEFKREAVRLVETSGLTIKQVSQDLGVGLSTLTRWLRNYRDQDLLSGPHDDVDKELARLRKENEHLRQERDLKKGDRFLCQGNKSMKFRLIDASKASLPVERICDLLDVSVSGYYAWKGHGPS